VYVLPNAIMSVRGNEELVLSKLQEMAYPFGKQDKSQQA
jgi:hypothetical protein